MDIEYTLEKSEYIEAKMENKYNSIAFRKQSFVTTYIFSFILLIPYALITKSGIIPFIVCYILVILIFPLINKRHVLRKTKEDARCKLYKYSLTLSDTGIKVTSNKSNTKLTWNSLKYFIEGKKYIHIYSNSEEDIFIPKELLQDNYKKQFLLEHLTSASPSIFKA